MVGGEQAEQVTDRVVVVAVEGVTSDLDHTGDISGFLDLNQTANVAELGANAS